jgi:hypothetical protein
LLTHLTTGIGCARNEASSDSSSPGMRMVAPK